MNLSIIQKLNNYEKVYEIVGAEPRSKEAFTEILATETSIKSSNTVSKYVKMAFRGGFPMIVVKDNKLIISDREASVFIEGVCQTLGMELKQVEEVTEQLSSSKKENRDEVPVISGVESPVVRGLKKKVTDLANEIAKSNTKWESIIHSKEEEIKQLQAHIEYLTMQSILKEMDQKPVVVATIKSEPAEVFERNYFLEHPKSLLDIPMLVSKFGGERSSFYTREDRGRKAKERNELTTENYRSRMAKILLGSKFLEHRVEDEDQISKEYNLQKKIYQNRLESIQLLLQEDMSNQMKLALYAGMHEYHGTEMEDLLNFAGDYCTDANHLIRLLENPKEFNNYQNIRGFLRQTCKASEARMKREAARELIAGDWYVVAEYNGKPCRFQMMPIDELEKFRTTLLENQYGQAVVEIDRFLSTVRAASFEGNNPDYKIIVEDKGKENNDGE